VTPELFAFGAAAGGMAAIGDLFALPRVRGERRALGPLVRAGRPWLPRNGMPLAELERRLAEAGRPGALSARDLLAAKTGAALVAAAGGLTLGTVVPGRLGLLVALAAPLAGFFAPDLWLARRRRERIAAVRRDLPALLDLLRVSVEAGVSLPEGLAQVARRSRAPLARIWGGLAAQVAVGVPLASALEAHRRELPIAEVEAFTGALMRATRHGAPLSGTLAAQAREARFARRRRIQEGAARAGPKMQLVVALLLVPSVMLLVAAALVSALSGDGAGGALITY
jgi:tight adherence protein C